MTKFSSLLASIVTFAGFISSAFTALALWQSEEHLLELLTHFRVQYLAFGVVLLFYWLLVSRRALLLFGLWCVLANAAVILPVYLEHGQEGRQGGEQGETIRLMVANVNEKNRKTEQFVDFVRQELPDVLAVLEVDNHWARALNQLQDTYPYKFEYPRADNFGSAIYSRLPLENVKLIGFDSTGRLSIVADVLQKQGPLHVVATHPHPPVRPSGARSRNEHLQNLGAYLRAQSGEVAVLADLNVSLWSPVYLRLEQDSGLRNARLGFGLFLTWPQQMPLLYIPIDHILLSPGLSVQKLTSPSIPGSDHRAIVADITVGNSGGSVPLPQGQGDEKKK